MSFAAEIKRLTKIAESPPKIAAIAASQIATQVDKEFAMGADPYGAAWAALAPRTLAKGRFPPPLTDTGATHQSVRAEAEGSNVRVTVDGQAHWHQSGTSNMPARPILPEDGGSLPDAGEKAFASAIKRILPGAL